MKIPRLDLDGAWSPAAIVTRILTIEPDLPIPVPIEQLCERLDILSISGLHTAGFEAALLADGVKSLGHILVRSGPSARRRRFSIAHELGHFLMPTHKLPAQGPLLCTGEQLTLSDHRQQDRRRKMEVQANQFAAMLLMPPPVLRSELRQLRQPDLADIVRLAAVFNVSKEAMAQAYTQYSGVSVGVVVVDQSRVSRLSRRDGHFPWIAAAPGSAVPNSSTFHGASLLPGSVSAHDECEPETWLGEHDARKVLSFTEQILAQQNGFALILLSAELREDDDPDEGLDRVLQSGF